MSNNKYNNMRDKALLLSDIRRSVWVQNRDLTFHLEKNEISIIATLCWMKDKETSVLWIVAPLW
jgi:hypothetical protein